MESRENREQSRCCNWKRHPSLGIARGKVNRRLAVVKTGWRKIRQKAESVQEPEYFVPGHSFAPRPLCGGRNAKPSSQNHKEE